MNQEPMQMISGVKDKSQPGYPVLSAQFSRLKWYLLVIEILTVSQNYAAFVVCHFFEDIIALHMLTSNVGIDCNNFPSEQGVFLNDGRT